MNDLGPSIRANVVHDERELNARSIRPKSPRSRSRAAPWHPKRSSCIVSLSMTTEFEPYHQNYDESILGSTYPQGAAPAPAPAFVTQHRQLDDIPPLEKEVVPPSTKPFWRTRKGKWIIAIVILVVIAVAIGVGLGVSRKSTRSHRWSKAKGTASASAVEPPTPTTTPTPKSVISTTKPTFIPLPTSTPPSTSAPLPVVPLSASSTA